MTNPCILKQTLINKHIIYFLIIEIHTLFSLNLERILNSLFNLITVFSRQKKNHFEVVYVFDK